MIQTKTDYYISQCRQARKKKAVEDFLVPGFGVLFLSGACPGPGTDIGSAERKPLERGQFVAGRQ